MKIPIKRFVDDPSLSWEERFKRLEKHHEEETTFLISKLNHAERLLKMVVNARDLAENFVNNLSDEIEKCLNGSN